MTVLLRGEIDIASAPALEKELGRAELASPDRLVLDCRELEFIDSSGLGVLVAAHQRATREGRELVLRNTPDHARRVFDVAGLAGWFVFA